MESLPSSFDKNDFDNFMIEGLMEQETFADIAKYPRFDRAYYIKIYCQTLKEYMKEIHILYNPKKRFKSVN